MKVFKKTVKVLGLLIVLISFVSSFLIAYLSLHPSLIINSENVLRLSKYLANQGIKLSWEDLKVNAVSETFWNKHVVLTSGKACFATNDIQSCFTETKIDAVLELNLWRPRLHFIQLALTKGELKYIEHESSQKSVGNPDEGRVIPSIPKELKYITADNIFIEFDKLEIITGQKIIAGAITLKAKGSDEAGLDYQTDLSLSLDKKKFEGQASGKLNASLISTNLTGKLKNPAEGVPNISFFQCHINLKEEISKIKQDVSMICPVEFTGDFPRFKNGPKEKIINLTKVKILANVQLENPPKKMSTVTGNIKIEVDSLFKGINDGKGSLTTDISGSLSQFPKNLLLNSQMHLEVSQFQNVVTLLRDYPWAIPSPFNTLNGNITLDVTGKGKLAQEDWNFPLSFKTNLSSGTQNLVIEGNGVFDAKKHLGLNISLNNVLLTLPELNLKDPASLFPDPRIKDAFKKVEKKNSPGFSYDIEITTPLNQPMRLTSSLVKDKVPLKVSLLLSDKKGVTGSVEVLSFPIELFKRKANVKHFALKLTEDPDKTEVNGLVEVAYTDYTVKVLVLGLLNSPQIRFVSDPPLAEDQVIAVLLFGKTPDSLDESQAASVGGTQSALADRAVNLVSMYLLASTPVESVGYDPATKVFHAKVRLANGTSLNLGSNMKALNQIGLRKILGPNLAIVSYLENPLDPVHRTLTAFLEWSKGY